MTTVGGSSVAPTLSVVIPTVGRRSLRHTLESLRAQRIDPAAFEVLVVGDGPQPHAREIFDRVALSHWRYLEHGPTRSSGNAQRMAGIDAAVGGYLLFIDDDDVYMPRAFERVLEATMLHPGRVLMFRTDRFGLLSWKRPELRLGNVGSLNFVVPRLPGRLGSFVGGAQAYTGDFDFIEQTVTLQGEPVWIDEVLTICDQPYWLPWRRKRSNRGTRALDRLRTQARVRTRLRELRRR